MAVTYKLIDGERVSKEWYTVLIDMRGAGVRFNVNEGHRTMARQRYFWDLYRSGRGNLAARPSPWAPHIRVGRIDHAIDFSNDAAVLAWLNARGLNAKRTVRGESWHIEVPAAKLRAYHAKHNRELPTLRRGQTGRSVRKLKRILRKNWNMQGFNAFTPFFDKKTEDTVKRFQSRHDLKADGVVGPGTWQELLK